MRSNFIGFVLTVFLIAFACKKEKDNCHQVIITNSAPGCEGWGIMVEGKKYPSGNIPDQFKQDGLTVCGVYELYADLRMCVCCGGTWADIKTMEINK
jgi:hypothetical protein